MNYETIHLEPGKGRGESVNRLLQYVMELPDDKRIGVDFTTYRDKLPSNLMARIKILVRALAVFNDVSYDEMNEIVHDMFYPAMTKRVAGVDYEVSVPTNRLHPMQARKIEADLYDWMGKINCPFPVRHGNSDL